MNSPSVSEAKRQDEAKPGISDPVAPEAARMALEGLTYPAGFDHEKFLVALIHAAGHYRAAKAKYEIVRDRRRKDEPKQPRRPRRYMHHIEALLFDCLEAWRGAGGTHRLSVSDDKKESPPVKAARAIMELIDGRRRTHCLRWHINLARKIERG